MAEKKGGCRLTARSSVFWGAIFLWVPLGITALMSITTFGNLERFYDGDRESKELTTSQQDEIISTQGIVFLGFLACLAYGLITFMTLMPRACCGGKRKQKAGFSYGMLFTSTLYSIPVFLFVGLTLIGTRSMAVDFWENMVGWNTRDTKILDGTSVMCFINSGLFVLYTVVLALCGNEAFGGSLDTKFSDLESAAAPAPEAADKGKKGKK